MQTALATREFDQFSVVQLCESEVQNHLFWFILLIKSHYKQGMSEEWVCTRLIDWRSVSSVFTRQEQPSVSTRSSLIIGGRWTKLIYLHLSRGISIKSSLLDVFDGFCNDYVFRKCENHTPLPIYHTPQGFPINLQIRPETHAHRPSPDKHFLGFCLRFWPMQRFLKSMNVPDN